jgi:bacterioferritin
MDLEYLSRETYQKLIVESEQAQDYISRDLAEGLLENVEAQIDWIESQQYVIDHSSIENYLQSMMA